MSIRPELQLQALVGPTHNYAGLGLGNNASAHNAGRVANPRQAALQSITLWRWLQQRGVPVVVMPPQCRPRLGVLETLGFSGTVAQKLQAAANVSPTLLRAVWSASAMWAANAATVTSAADSSDGRQHITPANLLTSLHRMLEAKETTHYLKQIFADERFFQLHDPLNVTARLADEGAANHMRLCSEDNTAMLQLFIYGLEPPFSSFPAKNMPRQTLAASQTVAKNHLLNDDSCLFFQQSPAAIDAGVFHHDVIGMSHRNLLILHECALYQQNQCIEEIQAKAPWLTIRVIKESELSLENAVSSYFFNAQLVTVEDGSTAIIFPQESAENPQAAPLADALKSELSMVSEIAFFDLRESMRNGGGPACLRLRIPANDEAIAAIPANLRFNTRLEHKLTRFIEQRYPERVTPEDLLNADFAQQAQNIHQDLLALLGIKPWR